MDHKNIIGAACTIFALAMALALSSIACAQSPVAGPKTDSQELVSTNRRSTITSPGATPAKETPGEVPPKTVVKPQASTGPKWQFAFAPYLYLTSISGTVGARGRTSDIDLSIGDVLSHFKAGFMGTFEARRGRLVIVNDLIWTKLSEERSTPGGLYDTGKVSVNMTIFNPDAGIRVIENESGSFDILGGVRITSVKTILSFTSGILPGFTAEQRKTWAAPVAGGHGLLNLSSKVYLSTFFDVGGGFGTHVTGQFYGGMGYRIKPKVAMIGGYRYLKNHYNDDNGFIFNTNMNGLLLGARFDL